MSVRDEILGQAKREGENTKRIIERLRAYDSKADFKPHEKSMTLKQLATHIVDLQSWFDDALKNKSFDFIADHKKIETKSFGELSDLLSKKVDANLAFVEGTDDSFWENIFKITVGDRVLVEAPKKHILRFFLQNHLIHHRGQLSVYLRLCDIPVPGLYGPSADEK